MIEQSVGYDVTNEYRGQRYTTRLREHPGGRLWVAASLRALGY